MQYNGKQRESELGQYVQKLGIANGEGEHRRTNRKAQVQGSHLQSSRKKTLKHSNTFIFVQFQWYQPNIGVTFLGKGR